MDSLQPDTGAAIAGRATRPGLIPTPQLAALTGSATQPQPTRRTVARLSPWKELETYGADHGQASTQVDTDTDGAEGRGDGPAGVGVEPAPINFHDETRARERSLFGLFNTITLGVDGTTMTSFAHLPDGDRWALAWYVGGLFASEAMLVEGQAAWKNAPVNLETAATRAPAELAAQRPDGEALMAWLRHNPQVLFADRLLQVPASAIRWPASAMRCAENVEVPA